MVVVHSSTVHMNLSIIALLFIDNTDTIRNIHSIHTHVIYFLLSTFLLMKVR